MSIIARKQKSDFTPCPEGLWPAVCIDVVDKGMVPTEYGPKHMIQIRWVAEAEPKRPDRKPYMISKKYTLSLHEKANLRKMLDVWRVKKFTEEELNAFDLETLIGVQCQIQVAHGQGDDGAYAFPQVILKAVKNGRPPVQVPSDYTRECNRPGYTPPQSEAPNEEELHPYQEITDDDTPF